MADYTGSFFGSFQGTISGSLLGSGIVSSSTQIDFNSIVNKPTTIQPFQANSITSNNQFRQVTYPAISASTSTRLTTIESNVSTLSTQTTAVSASNSTRFTTIESNASTLSTQTTAVSASNSTRITTLTSDVTTLSGQVQAAVSGTVPPGTISSSTQITALGYLTSASAAASGFGSGGGSTDISALNTFTGSAQTSLTALNSATSSYLTSANTSSFILVSQTSSMSVLSALTASFISSTFISASAAASGFGSGGGAATDISALNTFTGSAQTSLTALNSATSSFITNGQTSSMSVATASFISSTFISASAAASGFGSGGGSLTFITESGNLSLSEIEVADFDNNVAITFVDGRLKFIFGTPTEPTSLAASLSGFATDRFNNITDVYSVNGTWNNQGYTLVSASLYEGATLLTQVGSGTSLTFSTTTSGSHTYKLEYTASSPLDASLFKTSTTTTGTVSKTNPAAPTLSATPSVQLGFISNQIEQGATGSITFTSSSANPSNSWNLTSVTTNVESPYLVTGSATGSTSISIIATANYASPLGDNIPDLTTTSTTTTTYTKIRSLRYGASTATSFTAAELANLATWDTTLGGSIGTIDKGNVIPSGDSLTITWSGDKYHYIVYDSARSNLTNITTAGFSVFSSFTLTTVGSYKIYRSNDLQAGGAGNSITYVLT
jgi:hypothetical protein